MIPTNPSRIKKACIYSNGVRFPRLQGCGELPLWKLSKLVFQESSPHAEGQSTGIQQRDMIGHDWFKVTQQSAIHKILIFRILVPDSAEIDSVAW